MTGKKLSEMSLAELWALFPIVLTPHRTEWAAWYAEEASAVKRMLPPDDVVRISHVGSTAVAGIWAKPIVDILVEVRLGCEMRAIRDLLICGGFTCMSEGDDRMSFNKGYTEAGFAEKVFHLHLRYAGDNDELYFRDFLIDHPDVAQEYQAIKLSLWHQYEHNRDGYTQAKTDFVAEHTALAKQQYGMRY